MEGQSTRAWRYHDDARLFDESLAEIKVAEPKRKEPDVGGMDRIAKGETALASMPAERAAALASVPSTLQKHELKQKLQTLLAKKQSKVAEFIEASKQANLGSPEITLNAMSSGNGSPMEGRVDEAKLTRAAMHQGPAADLLAAGLKALKGEQPKIAAVLRTARAMIKR
jgi:hypothetical protein